MKQSGRAEIEQLASRLACLHPYLNTSRWTVYHTISYLIFILYVRTLGAGHICCAMLVCYTKHGSYDPVEYKGINLPHLVVNKTAPLDQIHSVKLCLTASVPTPTAFLLNFLKSITISSSVWDSLIFNHWSYILQLGNQLMEEICIFSYHVLSANWLKIVAMRKGKYMLEEGMDTLQK